MNFPIFRLQLLQISDVCAAPVNFNKVLNRVLNHIVGSLFRPHYITDFRLGNIELLSIEACEVHVFPIYMYNFIIWTQNTSPQ